MHDKKYTLIGMKDLKLSVTHYKVLDTIYYLNIQNKYPLADGVYKILAGIIDEETLYYQDLPTFGTLISFGSKKVCRYLLALQKHGYIRKRFDDKTNNLYFEISALGKSTAEEYHKVHKKPYPKKQRKITPTIIEL